MAGSARRCAGLALMLVLIGDAGCVRLPHADVAEDVLALPLKDRSVAFERYDWHTQYEVCAYALHRRLPPDMEFVSPLAMRGDSVAPWLRERLAGGLSERDLGDAVLILGVIQADSTYMVVRDSVLMRRLKTTVGRVRDKALRAMYEDELRWIGTTANRSPARGG